MTVKCSMKTTITIPVDELQTIRLVCKRANCGGVAEIPTSRLAGLVGQVECPSCHLAFVVKQIGGDGIGGLKALGVSLDNLIGTQDYEVEFVVPAAE